MSGIGESIGTNIVAELVVKCLGYGYHIVRKSFMYKDVGETLHARLCAAVNIIEAISSQMQDKEVREGINGEPMNVYTMIMDEIRHLLTEYVKRNCHEGTEKTQLLSSTSAKDLVVQTRRRQNMLSRHKGAEMSKFWWRLKGEAAWSIWGKELDDQLITEIEFWCGQLDTYSSCLIPGLFAKSSAPAIREHVQDSRLSKTYLNGQIAATIADWLCLNKSTGNNMLLEAQNISIKENSSSPSPSSSTRYFPVVTGDLGAADHRKWAEFRNRETGTWCRAIVELKDQPRSPDVSLDDERTQLNVLANILRLASQERSSFLVLECSGWFDGFGHFGLVYQFPFLSQGIDTCHSLSSILRSKRFSSVLHQNLENRVNLSKALAWTLFQFHAVNWVHKSVNPDNILIFGRRIGSNAVEFDWSHPYLVGFDTSRGESGWSAETPSANSAVQPYVHPERQDPENPTIRFKKYHDIYSLGVVLLEIGRLALFTEPRWVKEWETSSPLKVQQTLVKKAQDLKAVLGPKFSGAVVDCLTYPFGRPVEIETVSDNEEQAIEEPTGTGNDTSMTPGEELNNALLLLDFRGKVAEQLEQITV